jgi:predicted nuclease of predicted toxin-antitoxin system
VKILLDSCVWGGTKAGLLALGHDVVWCGDWERDPGDKAILETARLENRILVTLDKDFGELAIVRHMPHCGIIRLVGFRAREQSSACATVVEQYAVELLSGGIATVTPHQLRIRPA